MTALSPWSLTDQHGPWCAWCLEYFDSALLDEERTNWRKPVPSVPSLVSLDDRHEKHHILPMRVAGRLVGVVAGRPPTFDITFPQHWTVDVHHRCHRGAAEDGPNIQAVADSAATNLEHLLTTAQSLTKESPDCAFSAIDETIRNAFESGQYSIALFLNEAVRAVQEERDDWRPASETLNYQLSARAGIRGKMPLDLDQFCGSELPINSRALLHIANHQSNVGQLDAARLTFAKACEDLKPTLDLRLDLALRRAQIERTHVDAAEAVRIAESEGQPYRQNTARVLLGFLDLARGASSSQENFEAVLASTPAASWLYRAESWLGLGCVALKARHAATAYRYLIAAQYVFGFLGLQSMPHPESPFPGARARCVPAELLRSEPIASLPEESCLELRQLAIKDGKIKQWLTEELGHLTKTKLASPDPMRLQS
jgi:hypothetical protein